MQKEKIVTKQKNRLKKELSNWLNNPAIGQLFIDKSAQQFQKFIHDGQDSASLGLCADKLVTYHFYKYADAKLSKPEASLEDLALAACYAGTAVQLEEMHAASDEGGSLIIHVAAFYLAINVIVGWKSESDRIAKSLIKGLDSTLLDLSINNQHEAGAVYRHFWFILELYSRFSGQKLETHRYSYPEDMAPYQAVLDNWQTTDNEKINQYICSMADFHIEQAQNTQHDQIAEFDSTYQVLFPYEILFFLKVREFSGISNPSSFSHPLMQQPLGGSLPMPVLSKPTISLLDNVLSKVASQNFA